ncbi:MAG TPA: hypothetical protein VEL47_06280 [Myxococcota bacterium]|nr:hypothetical protein [Myxococcota bacterium]
MKNSPTLATIGLLIFAPMACQKPSAWAPAADNLSASGPPPMGARTYNDELKRELSLLDDLLNERISVEKLKKIKSALIAGNVSLLSQDKKTDEAHLVKILLALPELVHQTKPLPKNGKKWLVAKYYFLERRWVEAAMLMTEILQQENNDLIRNWRARAIFFLGNPDKAVSELKLIIANSGEASPQGLDALYLIGAMSYESHDLDARRVNTGLHAWKRYLEVAAPDEAMKQEIRNGLLELNRRLKGDSSSKPNRRFDPFQPSETYNQEKNAILRAFAKEELLLALELSEQLLKKAYDADIATVKARILFRNGQLDEALTLFSMIVQKDATYAPGFHYRGMVFMLQQRPREAILSWQKTLEIDEQYGNFHGLKQRIAVAEKMVVPKKLETH